MKESADLRDNMIFKPFKVLFLSSYIAIKERNNSGFDSTIYALALTSYCITILGTILGGTFAFVLSGLEHSDLIINFMADYGLIVYLANVVLIYVLYAANGKLSKNLVEYEKFNPSTSPSIVVFSFLGLTSLIALSAMLALAVFNL